jgi:hypothetical protein
VEVAGTYHDNDNDKMAVEATLTLDNAAVLIDDLEDVRAVGSM